MFKITEKLSISARKTVRYIETCWHRWLKGCQILKQIVHLFSRLNTNFFQVICLQTLNRHPLVPLGPYCCQQVFSMEITSATTLATVFIHKKGCVPRFARKCGLFTFLHIYLLLIHKHIRRIYLFACSLIYLVGWLSRLFCSQWATQSFHSGWCWTKKHNFLRRKSC